MKRIILVPLFFICLKGLSQYDTSHIRIVFDYIHTSEFRSSLEKLSDRQTETDIRNYKAIKKRAQSYRQQQRAHVLFWTSLNSCFLPSNDYFLPDTASRYKTDSLHFKKFDKQPLHMTYNSINARSCTERLIAQPYFLSDRILELHHFNGMGSISIKFGYTEILRFRINDNGKAELLLMSGIYHN